MSYFDYLADMSDKEYLAYMSDKEFDDFVFLMKPLVGVPQCRAWKHMREVELERRKQEEK